jgi:hypothetical protein
MYVGTVRRSAADGAASGRALFDSPAAQLQAFGGNTTIGMTDLTPDLQFLVGEPLNAVSFVMDYVELHFNGSYVRCLMPPTVSHDGSTLTFPGLGSRDALCGLIGAEVTVVQAEDGGELRIEFAGGGVVTASLSHESRPSPEALHFHNQDTGETQFW